MADGSMRTRNDGIVELKVHAKPTAWRLKAPEADGTYGEGIKIC